MSQEQTGTNSQVRENMDSQTSRPIEEAPEQGQYANQAQGGHGYGGHNQQSSPYPSQPPYPAEAYQEAPCHPAQHGAPAMHQDRYMGGAGYPPNQRPNMHQDRYMGNAGYPPHRPNAGPIPNYPPQDQGYHAMPQGHYPGEAGYPQGPNGYQMPNGSYQGHQGHQAPNLPYPPQNPGSYGPYQNPYQNPYYDPMIANPGTPPNMAYPGGYPARMPENHQPPHNGLSSFFDFRDERFLKGALVGAAVTFLLTNDSVQKNAIQSIVKVWHLFQGGIEEVKERFRDAEAEIKADDQS